MRFHALACDYDGTLAADGVVDEATVAALEAVRASGRRLLLVSGRELNHLQRVFDRLDLFDRVVTENGAVLYRPELREEHLLGEPPDERFVHYLRQRRVAPLSVGRSIVATWEPNDGVVLEAIRTLGLELQIVFNKGAVMVLPPGISKASGLMAALNELRLSPHNVVGVGDAENDHAFLALCEISAAVGNALPAVKARADIVLDEPRGKGVTRLAALLLDGGVQAVEEQLPRLTVPLGESDGQPVGPRGHRSIVLLAGTSGSGKSTLTAAFLETLADRGYQVCLVDPEGDYEHLERFVVLGTADRAPTLEEVLTVLEAPDRSVVVNLLGLSLEERPPFNAALLARLQELRAQVGRPHWIVLDEAHHLLPAHWRPDGQGQLDGGILIITVHPDRLAHSLLQQLDMVVALGQDAPAAVAQVANAVDAEAPPADVPRDGMGVLWDIDRSGRTAGTSAAGGQQVAGPAGPTSARLIAFTPASPRGERRRHRRKYAAGELGSDKSFWFRGPEERLNLRAQNLTMFVQIAEGVDDETWSYHLRRADYSGWIRDSIKDLELADEVAAVERGPEAEDADESRRRIREAVEARYSAPA